MIAQELVDQEELIRDPVHVKVADCARARGTRQNNVNFNSVQVRENNSFEFLF